MSTAPSPAETAPPACPDFHFSPVIPRPGDLFSPVILLQAAGRIAFRMKMATAHRLSRAVTA